MAVRLRALRVEDRPPLLDLLHATTEFTDAEVDVALELIDDRLGGGTHYRFAVAATDGLDPAGYACFGPAPMTDGVWDLYWLVVDAAARGQGVGATLLAAAEDAVRAEGGRMLLIETASKASYEPTRRFYRRCGYAEIARVPDYYRVGDDKIVYAKTV